MNKLLKNLLPGYEVPAEVEVNGITRDSRKVEPGNLFVAVPGIDGDGRNYIDEAIKKKAAAILYEKDWEKIPENSSVPLIGIKDLSSKIGEVASRFYDHPSMDLRIMAVTGTNGKTSCSYFIATALNALGVKCGVVGTLGSGFPEALRNPGLTTPETIELQKILADLKGRGASAVALEASSHGLDQGRLDGINIDIAVLTNISRDHLDYHQDFEHYKRSKSRLFLRTGLSGMVLNIDDELGRELLSKMQTATGVLTYSTVNASADIYAENCVFSENGIEFDLKIPSGRLTVHSPLIGKFNLANLLALAGVLYLLRFDLEQMRIALSTIRGVKGRMEVLKKDGFPTVVVDYAHTPDALEKALDAMRGHCKGKLVCVFGCGGDRDKGKRPMMGDIAVKRSDEVWITNDNPRRESYGKIIEDILSGVSRRESVYIESDRTLAIGKAIAGACSDDWILVAGKGHEAWQEMDGERLPYSDHEVVAKIFSAGNTKVGKR